MPKISFTRLMVTSSFFLCKITVQLRKYFSNYNQILNVHLLACFLNMSKNPSRVWGLSHSQQRVPNSPILPNPLFKNFFFYPLLFLLPCLVGWMGYLSTFDIHVKPWDYSTRRTFLCFLCNKASSLLRSDTFFTSTLISHTKTHIKDRG